MLSIANKWISFESFKYLQINKFLIFLHLIRKNVKINEMTDPVYKPPDIQDKVDEEFSKPGHVQV